MTKVVQDFLWAQKVQEPVALFSDWLYVGHIDEFMTFVPAPDRKVNIPFKDESSKVAVGEHTFQNWPPSSLAQMAKLRERERERAAVVR